MTTVKTAREEVTNHSNKLIPYCYTEVKCRQVRGRGSTLVSPSPEGSGGVFFPNQGPPIFYCSWVPKGPEKSGGPSQSGSFSATGTIKVRIYVFFKLWLIIYFR